MNAVLLRVAAAVERMPALALAGLLAITLVLGTFASQQQADTDMAAFAPESDLADAHERVSVEFGEAASSIQVMVDAGPGGDVVSVAGLRVAQQIAEIAHSTEELVPMLAPPTPEATSVVSYALPFSAALAQRGLDPATVDEAALRSVATSLLADPASAGQAAALLSEDLDQTTATARAGLVLVQLSNGPSAEQRAAAELAFRDALQTTGFDGFELFAVSEAIFADELMGDMQAEMPVLLGLALLLIIAILFVTYRRVADVLIGLAGLVITIVWTYGIAVLLGPGYLGITGVMSQISIMIPVLLVGLAIDFAIHLTSRYREELAAGAAPAAAAHGAVISVGGALVLATITTMVAFLTNLALPLPPMRDFGLFVAGGVLSAFVVMILLVPSARSLLDRRRAAAGTLKLAPIGSDRALGRVMARAAVLAERHAAVTLAVALVATLAAGLAGSRVSTTFSQDDFIPADSRIGTTLTLMDELFGGDLDETTNILLEGDLATPQAANAMLAAQAQAADSDYVRTAAGQAQVSSPVSAVLTLAADPAMAPRVAGLGLVDGQFAPDADVAAMYDLVRQAAPHLISRVLNDANNTGRLALQTVAGQDRADALRSQLEPAAGTLRAAGLDATIVSQFLMFDEALSALTASQARGIAITLLIALLVLVTFFTIRSRRPLLGVITMIPPVLVVAWVAGSMWALGLSFNVMTAMVASLAIGIGVPYGIHITNRFTEDLARTPSIDEAVRHTVVHTGGALVGSATTTAAGFGVLVLASLAPMRQFGIITALTIMYSLAAAILIEPACLKLWAQWRYRPGDQAGGEPGIVIESAQAPEAEPVEVTHRVGTAGRIVIPKQLRDELGIEPGDEVAFRLDGDRLAVRRVRNGSAPGSHSRSAR